MTTLSIATINTRGLNDPVKCNSTLSWLHSQGNDIYLLQECNLSFRQNYKVFEERWPYGQSVWSGDNKNRCSGVATLLKGNNFKIDSVKRVEDGRVLCVDVAWCGLNLRIINVYCPPPNLKSDWTF